jgi:hypothetical protein
MQSGESDDWVSFKEGVVAAHGWRLNPRLDYQNRYDQMVLIVDDFITQGLKPDVTQVERGFRDEAAASLAFWRKITRGP